MVPKPSLEVAKTVMELADMTWTAMECREHYRHRHRHKKHHDDPNHPGETTEANPSPESFQEGTKDEQELESLRSENRRLRNLLEQNLKLLENISESPPVSQSFPPDLQERIVSAVNSKNFLDKLEANSGSFDCKFPFSEASGEDLEKAEILINMGLNDPSWWVWISDGSTPANVEAHSEIDFENYVVVNEEQVVDGIANFMAKCILANPKAKDFTPKELQKALNKALQGVSKLETAVYLWEAGRLFYTLSTWGLALYGLYQTRGLFRVAAKGVHSTSKVVLKAL